MIQICVLDNIIILINHFLLPAIFWYRQSCLNHQITYFMNGYLPTLQLLLLRTKIFLPLFFLFTIHQTEMIFKNLKSMQLSSKQQKLILKNLSVLFSFNQDSWSIIVDF